MIVLLLHFGYGLLAMTLVMGISELIYIYFCYRASHRIVPEVQISAGHFTKSVFPELFRFAGCYQLVNVLELAYGAILPIVLLRFFGAEAAGVYAVASRVVASALIAQDALVLPILSGGTMVFTSGSAERVEAVSRKIVQSDDRRGVAIPDLCSCIRHDDDFRLDRAVRSQVSHGTLADRSGGLLEGHIPSSANSLPGLGQGFAG